MCLYHRNPAQHKLSASCASILSVEAVLCFPLCPSKVTVAWQLGQLCHTSRCSSYSPRLPKDACISAFRLLQPITPGSTRSLGQRHFSRCASNVGLCSCTWYLQNTDRRNGQHLPAADSDCFWRLFQVPAQPWEIPFTSTRLCPTGLDGSATNLQVHCILLKVLSQFILLLAACYAEE